MKKYIVKHKEGGKVFGEYNSREEASEKLMEYINEYNNVLDFHYISPFDFTLEEVECKEVNEAITDFDSAIKYLVGNTNDDFIVDKERFSKSVVPIKGVARLVNEINPKHLDALIAFNELFTIAQAWNKEDGFVPDFSDWNQNKWYPWFKYDKDAAGFVYAYTFYTPTNAYATIGSRLCFKTRERAEQFGKHSLNFTTRYFFNK